jgi:hypothetical protein
MHDIAYFDIIHDTINYIIHDVIYDHIKHNILYGSVNYDNIYLKHDIIDSIVDIILIIMIIKH